MEIPGFNHPPFVRGIRDHAGTWGWVWPRSIAQDDTGRLWADGTAEPKHEIRSGHRALLAWSTNGITAWIDPRGYSHMTRINGPVDQARWVPITGIMTTLPGYAEDDPR